LAEDLGAVLGISSGRIRPELMPFHDGFAAMRNPRAGVSWLRRPHVQQMLRTLAQPDTPLTHETLNSMSPWRSVAYLRDLLMLHGVLPPVDRHMLLFQRWLGSTLTEVDGPEHRQVVERFAAWHVQRRLRRFADPGPVTAKQTQQARAEIRLAIAFLTWLGERGRGFSTCGQSDVDAWYAGAYTARRLTHAFLRWSMRNQLLTSVRIPHQNTTNPKPISQTQRLATIRRLLTEDDIPLLTRVAATLMLLYAQPLARILRLTIDDVLHQDNEVSIRLGDPPTPIPPPFAGLLRTHIEHRLNLTTATNPDARWLFPGRRGGQPMTPDAIERRLRQHGIPALRGRTAALRQLVLQAPAPVVARMLGYTGDHTARLVAEVGGTWTRYAAGDHTRVTPDWVDGHQTRDS
jgi:integrase